MASSNLGQVKAGLEAFNADDFDRALETLSGDFTWDTTRAVPDGQVYVGREAIKRYWLDIGDRWTSLTIEADEWIESGDQVLMLGRLVGVGSGSGVPVVGPWCQVWSFEGDALVRCDNFSDPDAALAAAGLDEGD